MCNSGGESWRSSADVAERFPFSKATGRRWFGREVSDEQSCFRLVTAPQVCFAHWGTPTPHLIGNQCIQLLACLSLSIPISPSGILVIAQLGLAIITSVS